MEDLKGIIVLHVLGLLPVVDVGKQYGVYISTSFFSMDQGHLHPEI